MFRYPDKPATQLAADGLHYLRPEYIAQLKLDGWRCVVERTADDVTFTSRHKKTIPVSKELADMFRYWSCALPPGTIFDGEWLARRPACRYESLWLFDIMQLGNVPLWQQSTAERLSILWGLVPPEFVPPSAATDDYCGFFDDMRDRDDAEGIVLKRRTARYIGSYSRSALNPGWLKCKWRAGEDGRTDVYSRPRSPSAAATI